MSERDVLRLAIACPTRDSVEGITVKCLADLCINIGMLAAHGLPLEVCYLTVIGSMLGNGRNQIVKEALAKDCTHILWIDSDMVFPKDTFERLLVHNKPIAAASYVYRKRPSKPVACGLDGNRIYTEETSTGLVEADYVGHGVMLVNCDVYRALEMPWYMFGWSMKHQHETGEDVYFCKSARRIGASVWIDHDLSKEILHIGKAEYSWRHALEDRPKVFAEQELKKAEALRGADGTGS